MQESRVSWASLGGPAAPLGRAFASHPPERPCGIMYESSTFARERNVSSVSLSFSVDDEESRGRALSLHARPSAVLKELIHILFHCV